MNTPHRPHFVFLFSDTGGGHRSAAEAIIGALAHGYPDQCTFEMVDIFRDYAPHLLDRLPDIFPPLSRKPKLLGQIFQLSDDPRVIGVILQILWPYIRSSLARLIDEHTRDFFVAVHPLINIPLGHALEKINSNTPFFTVVTDLVTTHTTWFSSHADLIIVPTQEACQVGLKWGISPHRLKVIGLPVAEHFSQNEITPMDLRRRLDWPLDAPVVLIMGGGEGMGQIETIAAAIDEARQPVTLVIVAGRNKTLRQRLESRSWKIPTRVYGFVQEMPDFMHAADILLTKAGPGTISEAISAGLPVILFSRLDGTEVGNVHYLVDHSAGIWAPSPEQAVAALIRWLDHPDERARASSACRTLSRPHAAREIADLLVTRTKDIV